MRKQACKVKTLHPKLGIFRISLMQCPFMTWVGRLMVHTRHGDVAGVDGQDCATPDVRRAQHAEAEAG